MGNRMNSTLDGQKISAILLMVGGLVMIMSLLMAWFSYIGWTRTGFDLLSDTINDQGYAYAPHLALIVGIAAIVAGMLSLKFAGRAIPAIMIVLGIASIVLSAMFAVYCVEAQEYYKLPFVTVSAEAGVWVSIVGGIVVVVASLVMLVLSRPSAKGDRCSYAAFAEGRSTAVRRDAPSAAPRLLSRSPRRSPRKGRKDSGYRISSLFLAIFEPYR